MNIYPNKYHKWYYNIIKNAKKQSRSKKDSYYESHHIIPKCMGGSNSRQNLVLLTAREHYIVHHLLYKMYPNHYGIFYAFKLLAYTSREVKISARVFQIIKENEIIHAKQRNRKFMQTDNYKLKMSYASKKSWDKSSLNRKKLAAERIKKCTRKKVYAEGIIFDSLTLCAKHYNVCLETIRIWMRKGKNFTYI